jgi:VWFA-related protein
LCGIISILVLSFGFLASGQQGAPAVGAANRDDRVYRSGTTISVHSDLVLIPVTVTDRSGKVVSGLDKDCFTLFENNTKQEITHFATEDAPISVGIVFDTSDSMQPRMRQAREAVYTLLDNANPSDEFLLVRFSTEARIVVPLTSQVDEIRSRVGSLHVSGTTALLDGVRLALAEMKHAQHDRKALVIISDGEDNASFWTSDQLKAAAREEDVLLYAIRIGDSAETIYPMPTQQAGIALLKDITNQTGGRLFEVSKLKQLPEVAAKIGGWLRSQYILGYASNNSEKDGGYRRVELKIERPKGFPRLQAVWRKGYYAPKE